MTRRLLCLLAALIVAAAWARAFAADGPRPDAQGIAFLQLRLSPSGAELISSTIRPGRLKPGARHAGERLLLQVFSTAGALLWEGTLDDPRRQVLEDPRGHAQGSKHEAKVIERTSAELMTRVPFFEDGQIVRVSRVTPAASDRAHEKLLGTFKITE